MPFAIFIIWFVIVLGIVYIYFKHNICKSNTFLPMASIVCVSYILYNTQHTDIFDIVLYGEPVFCIFSVFISSKIFHADYSLKEYIFVFFMSIPLSLTFSMLCYAWNEVIYW